MRAALVGRQFWINQYLLLPGAVNVGQSRREEARDSVWQPLDTCPTLVARSNSSAEIHVVLDESEGWREYKTYQTEFEILNVGPQRASIFYEDEIWEMLGRDGFARHAFIKSSCDDIGANWTLMGQGAIVHRAMIHTLVPDATNYVVNVVGDRTVVHADDVTLTFDVNDNLIIYESGHRTIETTYQDYGDFWFPSYVVVSDYGVYRSSALVLSAHFNHLTSLSPNDLNLGLGSNIFVDGVAHTWDGAQLITFSELHEVWNLYPKGRPYPLMPADFNFE